MNFTKPLEHFVRVFDVEIDDKSDEELMYMIRTGKKKIEELSDLVKESTKIAKQVNNIEAGIAVLLKKLDEGVNEDS